MKRFVISWISFFNNVMNMEQIEAENEAEALKVAFKNLAGTEYYVGDGFDTDIKQAAFDYDGMIEALEIN